MSTAGEHNIAFEEQQAFAYICTNDAKMKTKRSDHFAPKPLESTQSTCGIIVRAVQAAAC